MAFEKLTDHLQKAERIAARGREIVSRQRALILDMKQDGHDKQRAESLLQTLLESQQLHEDTLDHLLEVLRAEAPEEWNANEPDEFGFISNEGNQVLSSLPLADLEKLQPVLERVKLKSYQRLQAANRKITQVYFLETGLVAMMAVTGAGRCETQIALLGKEGMTGLPILFGPDRSPFEVVVQVEGQGQCVSTEDLLAVADQSPAVREAMMRQLRATWLQFAHTAAVNAQGTIEERLADLLITAQDRLDAHELKLTHEQLATMMAVRRAGVTNALEHLEADGLIAKARGNITILDRSRLEHRVRHLC